MRLGTPEMAAHGLALSLALLLGVLIAGGPASAQDKPTLKDVLGRVQSESETKAVEDLVDKLKGTARKPARPQPAPGSPAALHPRRPRCSRLPPAGQGAARRHAAQGGLSVDAHSAPEAKPELKPDEADQARRDQGGAQHRSRDLLRLQVGARSRPRPSPS